MTTLSAAVDLPVGEYTVRDARMLALGIADSWDSAASRVDLALLLDDLTADVVAHAGGENDLRLELTLHQELLRVSVTDGSAVRPVVTDLRAGRGPLSLLAVLAHRWGHEPHQGGHRIWFELDAGPGPLDHDVLDPEVLARVRRLLGSPRGSLTQRLRGRAVRWIARVPGQGS
jgi:hypothetical protein